MFTLFHAHEWSEWEKAKPHYWDHAEFCIRYCKSCPEKEYNLIYLHCPQKKIKGEYCHWCTGWGEAWEKRLEKITVSCDDEDTMEKKSKKKGMPIKKMARNLAITLEVELNGKTLRQVAEEYKLKDHSSVRWIRDNSMKYLNEENIRKAVEG